MYGSLRYDENGDWRQTAKTHSTYLVCDTDGGREKTAGVGSAHPRVREPIGEITRVDKDQKRFSAQATLRHAKRRCVNRMRAFGHQVGNYTLRRGEEGGGTRRRVRDINHSKYKHVDL